MSHQAMNWAKPLRLRRNEKTVLLILADHAHQVDMTCRLSLATIALEASVSERSARRALAWLVDAGMIEATRNGGRSVASTFRCVVGAVLADGVVKTRPNLHQNPAKSAPLSDPKPGQTGTETRPNLHETRPNGTVNPAKIDTPLYLVTKEEPEEVPKGNLPPLPPKGGTEGNVIPLPKPSSGRKPGKQEPPPPMPDWLPRQPWDDYVEHRTGMKHPLTAKATGMLFTRLAEYRSQGFDVGRLLNDAVINGWRGVFLPKDRGPPGNGANGHTPPLTGANAIRASYFGTAATKPPTDLWTINGTCTEEETGQ